MKEKFLILISMVIACFLKSNGQVQFEKNWLPGAKIISGKAIVSDNNFSLILYQGITWGGSAGVVYQQRRSLHEFGAAFTRGHLKAEGHTTKKLEQNYWTADYTNLYQIGRQTASPVIFRGGGSLNLLYARRKYDGYINRTVSYEFAASLGAVAELLYYFGDMRNGLSLSNRITLPLLSFVIQPVFGNDYRKMRLPGTPSFLRIKNLLTLSKNIGERQKLAIDYTWDYYQVRGPAKMKQVNHLLGFAYCFIF